MGKKRKGKNTLWEKLGSFIVRIINGDICGLWVWSIFRRLRKIIVGDLSTCGKLDILLQMWWRRTDVSPIICVVSAVSSNSYLGWCSSKFLQIVQSINEETVLRSWWSFHPVGPSVSLNRERDEGRRQFNSSLRLCQGYNDINRALQGAWC